MWRCRCPTEALTRGSCGSPLVLHSAARRRQRRHHGRAEGARAQGRADHANLHGHDRRSATRRRGKARVRFAEIERVLDQRLAIQRLRASENQVCCAHPSRGEAMPQVNRADCAPAMNRHAKSHRVFLRCSHRDGRSDRAVFASDDGLKSCPRTSRRLIAGPARRHRQRSFHRRSKSWHQHARRRWLGETFV